MIDTIVRLTYTVEEVAKMVSLSEVTIRRNIRSGHLKAASGGGKSSYRISRLDLEAWWRKRGGGELISGSASNGQAQGGASPHNALFAPPTLQEVEHRLAALEALGRNTPQRRAAAGYGALDLAGERAEVYGYAERENAQR